VPLLHAGHSRAAVSLPADPTPITTQPSLRDGDLGRPLSGSVQPPAELEALIEPMLAAIVRLADADAGTVRVIAADGVCYEPVVAVGIPGAENGARADARSAWCNACSESRDAQSECVRNEFCGHEEKFPADFLGAVCKQIVSVPLRHRDTRVGVLNLMFAAKRPMPDAMTPLLQATGDLLGMTLDNARLARENLRIRLTNERQMLANEVHDSLAQGLTYMRMRMSLLRDAIRRADELNARKFWSDVDDTLGNSQRRLRELITYFRGRMDPQGLLHALTETSDRFLDRTGVALEFVNLAPELCLPPEREIEVFHIVQESLANICRHAHATRAKLLLSHDDAGYMIVIEDDGVGMAAYPASADQDDSGHYGLAIMQERARRLGGSVVHKSGPSGTRVELRFPEQHAHDEARP